jgi:hypothetical protein
MDGQRGRNAARPTLPSPSSHHVYFLKWYPRLMNRESLLQAAPPAYKFQARNLAGTLACRGTDVCGSFGGCTFADLGLATGIVH